jgi:hypothetical protein
MHWLGYYGRLQGSPLVDVAIAGEQDRILLLTAAHELKEQMRGIGFEWQIAELVDNQQLGFGEVAEPLLRRRCSGRAARRLRSSLQIAQNVRPGSPRARVPLQKCLADVGRRSGKLACASFHLSATSRDFWMTGLQVIRDVVARHGNNLDAALAEPLPLTNRSQNH